MRPGLMSFKPALVGNDVFGGCHGNTSLILSKSGLVWSGKCPIQLVVKEEGSVYHGSRFQVVVVSA
jgi:hypothetical protein